MEISRLSSLRTEHFRSVNSWLWEHLVLKGKLGSSWFKGPCFLGVLQPSISYIFFLPPLMQGSLSPKRRDWRKIPSLRLSAPNSVTLLHIVWLWVSILITIYYKKKCFWWGLSGDVLIICVYKDKNLEVSLTWCPCNKVMAVSSSLGSVSSNQRLSTRFAVLRMHLFLWADLTPNQKVVGYPHNIHATIVSIATSCHICYYYRSQCNLTNE